MKLILGVLVTCILSQNIFAKNPKAEVMAELFVKSAIKAEAMFGKNPNMDIKVYNIKNYIYQDRTEYYYSASDISQLKYQYVKSIETEYCPSARILKDKYDVVFIFNVFGKYGKKAFTHTLLCE